MVTTRPDWYNFLKWYEEALLSMKKAREDIRVIDATEGGAKIHGTEIMTLQNAIDECKDENGDLPNYDFEKELEKLDYFLNDEEYKQLCLNHKKNISVLKVLINDAEEVKRTCKKLLEGLDKGTISNHYLDKQRKIIKKKHEYYMNSPWHSLINANLSGSIIDVVSHLSLMDGDKKETEYNGIKLMQIAFEQIAIVSEKILENVKKYEELL